MKRIIILEGISSSGKTTLERMLHDALEGSILITEGTTLMPIIDERDPHKVEEHLIGVLDEIDSKANDTIIVDRFHVTQVFRAHLPPSIVQGLEQQLCNTGHPFLVLLSMQEEAILDRIKETDIHRAGTWLKKKQGTYEERAAYYTEQQKILKQQVRESNLPTLILDTTDKNWDRCLTQIVDFIGGV